MDWLFDLLPDPGTLDAILLGLFVAPVAVLGVPVLRALIKVPRKMEIVEVPDYDVPPNPAEFFTKVESRLRTEGYNPIATFSAANLPGYNLNRAYVSAGDPAVAMATVAMHDQEGLVLGARYVEFVTEYADGSTVATRSAAADDPFDLMPGYRRFVHSHTDDALSLKQLHDTHCKGLEQKQPQHLEPAAFFDHLRDYHQRWVAYQQERGLLRRLKNDDEQAGATVRLALRGIGTFFNPFAEGFTLQRFVLALTLGLFAPALAIAALHQPALGLIPGLVEATGWDESLVFTLAMAPVLLAGAAAVGWIFTGNAFLWSFLIAYASSRLLLPEGVDADLPRAVWIGTLASAPLLAQRVESFRNRRLAS
jgi:hypothetical protein